MNIRYRVTLTSDERQQLQALVSGGKAAARKIKRAQILLAADAKSTDEAIAIHIGVGTSTPTQASHAISYVLNNWRKHGEHRHTAGLYRGRIDPFSSGAQFYGWSTARWRTSIYPRRARVTCHVRDLIGSDRITR